MGAAEPVEEREVERRNEEEREENGRYLPEEKRMEDLEKGEKVGVLPEQVMERDIKNINNQGDLHVSMLHKLNPTNPLRIILNGGARVATPSLQPSSGGPSGHQHHQHRQSPVPLSVSTPQQPAAINLNSKAYTDKVSLFLFALHLVLAVGLVCFLVFKGIQGLFYASESIKRKEKRVLQYFLPQVEVASLLSISLAFAWQKAVRLWPKFMVHFILWGSFALSLSAGILLVCFQMPATEGVGVCFLVFAIGNGLYACWVSQRIGFCSKVFVKSLEPVCKFPDLNQPTYWMLGAGFLWMSFWILAIIGALNFYFPPLTIIVLVLSLLWTAEVMRNVANITVSRVISLYYLRGMQCNTQFCLQRALTRNLGSASLGSLFVPTIEALRILARGLNLLEGEDEFMFSCAHCCLHVMNLIFRRGNSWAFVQIASYGKDFVRASQDTWKLFEMTDMVQIVDSDITSSICFLTGVCSGSICVIVIASWTFTVHRGFTATISLLSFIVGYLMTRIAMALPHACVSCYYVCYAENPDGRLFDDTIKDRQALLKSNRDVIMTPRMPRRSRT
ncbi:unnamed protein product [Citrullus colocynthis]|uniref:Choline transporter-like protein n=1 Tax=Citrullus colocynthis TaxID=252529 RepID=A0ABP0YUD0_9ROSI